MPLCFYRDRVQRMAALSGGGSLADALLPIIVGFLLTTVVGGFLGSWLQRRTWDHQKEVQLREDEMRRADEVCKRISGLLDKRLYRMRRLFFALALEPEAEDKHARIVNSLKEYNAVLYEWNDNLNLNLAQVGTYFGTSARDWLDGKIYEEYKNIGAELENCLRNSFAASGERTALETVKKNLDSLSSHVYRLGVFMMTQLREGNVGRTAPDALHPSNSPEQVQVPSAAARL